MKQIFLALFLLSLSSFASDSNDTSEEEEIAQCDYKACISAVGGYGKLVELYAVVFGEEEPNRLREDIQFPFIAHDFFIALKETTTEQEEIDAIDQILLVFPAP